MFVNSLVLFHGFIIVLSSTMNQSSFLLVVNTVHLQNSPPSTALINHHQDHFKTSRDLQRFFNILNLLYHLRKSATTLSKNISNPSTILAHEKQIRRRRRDFPRENAVDEEENVNQQGDLNDQGRDLNDERKLRFGKSIADYCVTNSNVLGDELYDDSMDRLNRPRFAARRGEKRIMQVCAYLGDD